MIIHITITILLLYRCLCVRIVFMDIQLYHTLSVYAIFSFAPFCLDTCIRGAVCDLLKFFFFFFFFFGVSSAALFFVFLHLCNTCTFPPCFFRFKDPANIENYLKLRVVRPVQLFLVKLIWTHLLLPSPWKQRPVIV